MNESLKIRMLRVKVSGLIKYEEENEKSKKVSSYFENLKDAYQKQIKERNVMNEIKDDKQLNLNKSKSNNNTKNSLKDKKKSKGKRKLSVPCTDILKLLENMKSKQK